jgi:hypothetical protein
MASNLVVVFALHHFLTTFFLFLNQLVAIHHRNDLKESALKLALCSSQKRREDIIQTDGVPACRPSRNQKRVQIQLNSTSRHVLLPHAENYWLRLMVVDIFVLNW